MNALVMYDRETDSLWSQFLGEAVEGPLLGAKLMIVPAQLVPWENWKTEHPDTLVLDTGRAMIDPYLGYYFGTAAGILGEENVDDRLHTKELVMGLVGEASQRAYAYRHMAESGVINDTFEGRHVLVVMNGDSGAATIFDRTVGDRTLTFDQGDGPADMTDQETGSTWQKSTGKAVGGPLEGQQLEILPSFAAFWFSWTDFYPDTELFEP